MGTTIYDRSPEARLDVLEKDVKDLQAGHGSRVIKDRLDTLEKAVGELIARHNSVVPILRQMPGLVALVEESGKQQIQLGEELKGYVDEVSKILALLQAERNESEKGKADA